MGLVCIRVLTTLKFLRGTRFDPFGYTAERRIERKLISEYRVNVEELLEHLNETNVAEAAELASWPENVRGYGKTRKVGVGVTQLPLGVCVEIDAIFEIA